ncbi:putative adhesin [Legionella israelensis]|uniref:Putative adhesin Stv domain-containing protein n=2 Tax=Legionella israelensis TaxID=454 RepID=A0A0W0V483_9GAMM|nr:hypothetical protein [Legionella israelensis]KTD14939.1 hypothetical protein Lisr_2284 [Legionella israelensis]SCY23926.1 hypothetical protein SAMN02746069_01751 [Legionella israelensis DSM 19235]STX60520.1 Uncharacterised protein [Legionella israelensis]
MKEMLFCMGHGVIEHINRENQTTAPKTFTLPPGITLVFYTQESWGTSIMDYTYFYSLNMTHQTLPLEKRLKEINKHLQIKTGHNPFRFNVTAEKAFKPIITQPGETVYNHVLLPLTDENLKDMKLTKFKQLPNVFLPQSQRIFLSEIINAIYRDKHPQRDIELHWLCCRSVGLTYTMTESDKEKKWEDFKQIKHRLKSSIPLFSISKHAQARAEQLKKLLNLLDELEKYSGMSQEELEFNHDLDDVVKLIAQIESVDTSLIRNDVESLFIWCGEFKHYLLSDISKDNDDIHISHDL